MPPLHSHTDPDVSLQEHLGRVARMSRQAVEQKNLKLTLVDKSDLADIACLLGACHDLGKATTFFQRFLHGKKTSRNLTPHAMISALGTYEAIQLLLPDNPFAPLWGYLAVRYHHGNLQDPDNTIFPDPPVLQKQWHNITGNNLQQLQSIYRGLFDSIGVDAGSFLSSLDDRIESGLDRFERDLHKTIMMELWDLESDRAIECFLITNFLYSVLVDSDKRVAGEMDSDYFQGATEPVLRMEDFLEYMRAAEPEKFNPDLPLNRQKNAFFQQVAHHEELRPENHLYTLTAPTGIGKTFAVYAATTSLKEQLGGKRHVVYALPFTSIIDQNFGELEKVVQWQDEMDASTKYLLKHHYLALAGETDDHERYSQDPAQYLRDKLKQETWESGYVVTTFVQLFQSIIGHRNRPLKKFHNIANAIVVLDEIQNLPAGYHELVRRVFRVLADRFDTYFVLMTATQPEIFTDDEAVELGDPSFFRHPLFNRIKGRYLPEERSVEEFPALFEDTFDGQSALVVTNTRKSALEIFASLREQYGNGDFRCFCLTTYLTPQHRRDRIENIRGLLREGEKVLCVSTQLIEAGVDLSFQYAYRDIGPFDSLVQVAGRCNRYGEYSDLGRFLVVNLHSDSGRRLADYVYDPKILEISRDILRAQPQFDSSDLFSLSQEFFAQFDFTVESQKLLKGISNLNYTASLSDRTSVSEFELIQEIANRRDLVVATSQETEQELWNLEETVRAQQDHAPYSPERDRALAEMILLKKRLAEHTITIYQREFSKYQDTDHIREAPLTRIAFVPIERLDSVYSIETGFNPDPTPGNLTTTRVL